MGKTDGDSNLTQERNPGSDARVFTITRDTAGTRHRSFDEAVSALSENTVESSARQVRSGCFRPCVLCNDTGLVVGGTRSNDPLDTEHLHPSDPYVNRV